MWTYQGGVSDKLPSEPEERLLEIIIRLGRNIVILEIFFAVEGDCLRLDLPLLNVDLVSTQNDRNVLAHANKIAYGGG